MPKRTIFELSARVVHDDMPIPQTADTNTAVTNSGKTLSTSTSTSTSTIQSRFLEYTTSRTCQEVAGSQTSRNFQKAVIKPTKVSIKFIDKTTEFQRMDDWKGREIKMTDSTKGTELQILKDFLKTLQSRTGSNCFTRSNCFTSCISALRGSSVSRIANKIESQYCSYKKTKESIPEFSKWLGCYDNFPYGVDPTENTEAVISLLKNNVSFEALMNLGVPREDLIASLFLYLPKDNKKLERRNQIIKEIIDNNLFLYNLNKKLDSRLSVILVAIVNQDYSLIKMLINQAELSIEKHRSPPPGYKDGIDTSNPNDISLKRLRENIGFTVDVNPYQSKGDELAISTPMLFDFIEFLESGLDKPAELNRYVEYVTGLPSFLRTEGIVYAIYNGHFNALEKVLKKILAIGGPIQGKTEFYMGQSLMYYVIRFNQGTEIADLLFKYGASVDADDVNTTLTTAVLEAAKHMYYENSDTGNIKSEKTLKTMEFLINKGADINKRGFGRDTPLHLALRINNPYIIRMLLKHDVDVLEKMMDAIHLDVSIKEDINKREDFYIYTRMIPRGPTPLQYCIDRGMSSDIVDLIKTKEEQQKLQRGCS